MGNQIDLKFPNLQNCREHISLFRVTSPWDFRLVVPELETSCNSESIYTNPSAREDQGPPSKMFTPSPQNLMWQKGLSRCDGLKSLRWEMTLGSGGGPEVSQRSLREERGRWQSVLGGGGRGEMMEAEGLEGRS